MWCHYEPSAEHFMVVIAWTWLQFNCIRQVRVQCKCARSKSDLANESLHRPDSNVVSPQFPLITPILEAQQCSIWWPFPDGCSASEGMEFRVDFRAPSSEQHDADHGVGLWNTAAREALCHANSDIAQAARRLLEPSTARKLRVEDKTLLHSNESETTSRSWPRCPPSIQWVSAPRQPRRLPSP